jgi:tetratricopeptide (TPR) repeat protein
MDECKSPSRRIYGNYSTLEEVCGMSHQGVKAGVLSKADKVRWMQHFTAIAMFFPGDKKKIIDACNQAIQIDYSFSDAHFCKGVALQNLGRYIEALLSFDLAIKSHGVRNENHN